MIDEKIYIKLKAYQVLFGKDNVRLVLYSDGHGAVDIGHNDNRFTDSFDNIEEYLSKSPELTKKNAIKWGWLK